MEIRASDFDYPLDETLIAQEPLPQRDQSRLMVLRRRERSLEHHVFRELPSLLRKGDVLVVNETAVIPARFACRRNSGGRVEGLFLREREPGEWEVLLGRAGRCRIGEELAFEFPTRAPREEAELAPRGGPEPAHPEAGRSAGAGPSTGARLRLLQNLSAGRWRVGVVPARAAREVLLEVGATPVPPYIRRRGGEREDMDRPRYQTVYASVPGAVAAPTAGLHFTPELFRELQAAGHPIARVTLHVGMGTFLPVKGEELSRHAMHAEWYELSEAAADTLNAARRELRRIVAVGTTSVRVLETAARRQPASGTPLFAPQSGWTDIFLYPPCEFRAVDALITNFHLPRSTLLMLVAAFCSPGQTDGLPLILDAYAQAARLRYRFYSYGDAMLIE
jgi:S-adenosylmethionine:tRNA ribosyltransferase-isomerase